MQEICWKRVILSQENTTCQVNPKTFFLNVFFICSLLFCFLRKVILAEGLISYTTYIIMVAVRLHLTTDQIVIQPLKIHIIPTVCCLLSITTRPYRFLKTCSLCVLTWTFSITCPYCSEESVQGGQVPLPRVMLSWSRTSAGNVYGSKESLVAVGDRAMDLVSTPRTVLVFV